MAEIVDLVGPQWYNIESEENYLVTIGHQPNIFDLLKYKYLMIFLKFQAIEGLIETLLTTMH